MGWSGTPQARLLITTDNAGAKHKLYYVIEDNGYGLPDDFTVMVTTDNSWPPNTGRYYEMSFARKDGKLLQTVNMDHHDDPDLRGKGISASVLKKISKLLGEDIVSSPEFEHMGNRRSDRATLVWERLVHEGVAIAEADRFRLLNDRL